MRKRFTGWVRRKAREPPRVRAEPAARSGHGGQQSGRLPEASGISPKRCPSCRRNGVRHYSGIASGMDRCTQLPRLLRRERLTGHR